MSRQMKLARKKKHRYMAVADALREDILSGKFAEGNNFPTESVLCEKFSVSRFTVREALRTLMSDDLIARKHGSGTIVQPSTAHSGALHQPLSNVGEIEQYARDTTIIFETKPSQEISIEIAEQVGGSDKRAWFAFLGKRFKPGQKLPIAVTAVWLDPELTDVVEKINLNQGTLFGQIEQRHM